MRARADKRPFCRGVSMKPLIRPLDEVDIVSCDFQSIQPGDVVVYKSPSNEKKVMHRVVSVEKGGIRTQGDNSHSVDSHLLTENDIIGRVDSIEREGKRIRVRGGRRGDVFGVALRAIRKIDHFICRMLVPIARLLAEKMVLYCLLRVFIEPKLVGFRTEEGPEWQVVIGRFVAARFLPSWGNWVVRRPFYLFVGGLVYGEGKWAKQRLTWVSEGS